MMIDRSVGGMRVVNVFVLYKIFVARRPNWRTIYLAISGVLSFLTRIEFVSYWSEASCSFIDVEG